MTDFVWGIDLSDWQYPFDCKELVANGMTFGIAKVSMGYGRSLRYKAHLSNFRAAGVYTGGYHWVDPIAPMQDQVDRFVTIAQEEKLNFIVADHEQWWADWNLYNKFRRNEIPYSKVPKLTSKRISSFGKLFMDKVAAVLPDLRFYNYTARWFVEGHAPDMIYWINDYPLFIAEYPGWKGAVSWKTYNSILEKLQRPVLPVGTINWELRQFANDKLLLPGMLHGVDYDIFHGTREEFSKLMSGEVPVPPDEEESTYQEYRVLAWRLRQRSSPPGGSYKEVGYYKLGDKVRVYEVRNGWGKVSSNEDKWVSMSWLKKV